MQIVKLGALTALGAVLALPAMAQVRDLDIWQHQNRSDTGYNEAFNASNGLCCGNGSAQNGSNTGNSGPSGSWSGGGYGPRAHNGSVGAFNGPGGNPGNSFSQNEPNGRFNGPNGNWNHNNSSQNGPNGGFNGPNGNPGSNFSQNEPNGRFNGPNGNWNHNNFSQNGPNGAFNGGNGEPGNPHRWFHHSAVGREMHMLRQDLEQAGFTDLRIMPESFLVRARDRQGHTVMMVVSPDSITGMTASNAGANGPGGATMGSGGTQSGGMGGNLGPTNPNDLTGNRE